MHQVFESVAIELRAGFPALDVSGRKQSYIPYLTPAANAGVNRAKRVSRLVDRKGGGGIKRFCVHQKNRNERETRAVKKMETRLKKRKIKQRERKEGGRESGWDHDVTFILISPQMNPN